MAEAGFECFTEDGRLQFSSKTMAYTFHSKINVSTFHQTADVGPVTGPANIAYLGCRATITPPSGVSEFIVAARTTTGTPVAVVTMSETTFVSGSPQIQKTLFAITKVPATVTCYFFAPTNQVISAGASSYGLQIFSASGQLTYDSNYVPMRVVRKDSNPSLANGASTSRTGLNSSRVYAWTNIGSLRRGAAAYSPPAPYDVYNWNAPYTYAGVRRVSTNAFAIEPVTTSQLRNYSTWYSTPSSPSGQNAGGVLTIDVTGL